MMDSTKVLQAQVPFRAAYEVAEYLLEDEQQHFLGCIFDREASNHIFMSLCPLALALGLKSDIDPEALDRYDRLCAAKERKAAEVSSKVSEEPCLSE